MRRALLLAALLGCRRAARLPDAAVRARAPDVAVSSRLRVGVNGARRGPAAAACRGYALRYADPGARHVVESESLSDVWWTLGRGSGNALEVTPRAAVAFAHVAVDWFGQPSEGRAECGARVDVEADGRVVASVAPPAGCARAPSSRGYAATSVVALPGPVRAARLRLVDRTPAALPEEGGGSMLVAGFTLSAEAPPPPVTVTVDLPRGLWVTAPDGARRRVEAPWLGEASDVMTEAEPEGAAVYLAAPASMGNEGALARRLWRLDVASGAREPALVAEFGAAVRGVWFDRCAGALHVDLDDGSRLLVRGDGTRVALPRLLDDD